MSGGLSAAPPEWRLIGTTDAQSFFRRLNLYPATVLPIQDAADDIMKAFGERGYQRRELRLGVDAANVKSQRRSHTELNLAPLRAWRRATLYSCVSRIATIPSSRWASEW